MEKISEAIKDYLLKRDDIDIKVEDVRIGNIYTAVLLEDGRCGLAYTFKEARSRNCSSIEKLLERRSVTSLFSYLSSFDPIEMAVALATSNAITNCYAEGLFEGDVLDHVDIREGDTVGMIGHFAPLTPKLNEMGVRLYIFERIKEEKDGILPETLAYSLLPECQVSLISSTSILNHSIDPLLEACSKHREVVLLGATTPIIKEVFLNTPVTLLSGVIIKDCDEILKLVSRGKGRRSFSRYVKKVNLRIK